MKIGFFGRLAERIGREIEVEGADALPDVAALRRLLAELHPHAQSELLRPSTRAVVDDAMVADSHGLERARRVEFFPPLSGG